MKYTLFAFVIILRLYTPAQAQEMDPRATEDWSRKPKIVAPAPYGQPPSDATILFCVNKDSSLWQNTNGGVLGWKVQGNEMQAVPDAGDIQTRKGYGNVQVHLEWKTPDPGEDHSNNMGNSGVFLMGLYELQIYESYQNQYEIYYNGQAGSIYKQHIPLVNASAPPQNWQSFDIVFTAPVFHQDKSLASPAYMTVFHNHVLILNHVALLGPMQYQGKPSYRYHQEELPLRLQEHDSRVSFRNIWIRKL